MHEKGFACVTNQATTFIQNLKSVFFFLFVSELRFKTANLSSQQTHKWKHFFGRYNIVLSMRFLRWSVPLNRDLKNEACAREFIHPICPLNPGRSKVYEDPATINNVLNQQGQSRGRVQKKRMWVKTVITLRSRWSWGRTLKSRGVSRQALGSRPNSIPALPLQPKQSLFWQTRFYFCSFYWRPLLFEVAVENPRPSFL